MYFWGTIAVVFALACLLGWMLDRRHRRVIGRNARGSAGARADETSMNHQQQHNGGPFSGL